LFHLTTLKSLISIFFCDNKLKEVKFENRRQMQNRIYQDSGALAYQTDKFNQANDYQLDPLTATRTGAPACLMGRGAPGAGMSCGFFGTGSPTKVSQQSWMMNLPRVLSKDLKCDQMIALPDSLFPNEKYVNSNIYGSPPDPVCKNINMQTNQERSDRLCTSLTETNLAPYVFFPQDAQPVYYANPTWAGDLQARETSKTLMNSPYLYKICSPDPNNTVGPNMTPPKSYGYYPTAQYPKYV
jgi:hypothetical protein